MPEFKQTCEYRAEVKVKTGAALLAIIDDDEHWIPFSQICDSSEITEDSDVGDEGSLIVSEWIALEKGLE